MADMLMAVMHLLPIGYRFHPTEEELLRHYLKRKNLGLDEPVCVIPEVDLCSWEPEQLRGKFLESSIVQLNDLELWFFCEQKPGRTHQRSTKGGFWKKTGQTRDMRSKYGTKEVIGSKKILTFFRGNSSSNMKSDWVLHEYHLPSNALDGLLNGNRKNYVLCMIKCNSDEMANSPPSYECDQDEPMTDIFDQEADDGFIPEHLVQAKMRSLEPLCRTSNHSLNANIQPIPAQFPEYSNSSPDSSHTQFSLGRESIELDLPFPTIDDLDILADILNQDDNFYETLRPHQQHVVIMENKQTQRVESLHAFLPIDEKKGIVEDDSAQPSAASLRMETPRVKSEKKSPKTVLSTSIQSSEAKALKQAPHKIKEEMVPTSSSSTSTRQPRVPVTATAVERHIAAATAKKKEINTVAALTNHEKPAREMKPITATMKPISHSSTCSRKKCSCSNAPMVSILNVLVGVLLCIAIFCEIFNL